MKKINISEEKFKKALKEIFKEEMQQSNQEPFDDQKKEKELEMGVGDDGTLNHDVGTVGEPSDPTEYDPGFEEEYEDPFNQDGWENHTPSDNDLENGRW